MSSLKNNFLHFQRLFRIHYNVLDCPGPSAYHRGPHNSKTGRIMQIENQLSRKWANPILPRGLGLRGNGGARETASELWRQEVGPWHDMGQRARGQIGLVGTRVRDTGNGSWFLFPCYSETEGKGMRPGQRGSFIKLFVAAMPLPLHRKQARCSKAGVA